MDRNPHKSAAAKQKALARRAYADPVFFCKYFLPHIFPGPMPWFQRGILAVLTKKTDFLDRYGEVDKIIKNFVYTDKEGNTRHIFSRREDSSIALTLGRYTLIMCPRGSAKTSIAGIAVPLYEIVFQELRFFMYLSNAAPHSMMQLDNVKRELTDNDRITKCFGILRPERRDDEKWSERIFETTTGICMAARGRGGQVRGALHRGNRPSKIIVDDLEDIEGVATEAQRLKTRNWCYGDLEPALPKLDPNAQIIALGTLLHPQSQLVTWAEDPKWSVVKLAVVDVDGAPIWPAWMEEEDIKQEKASYMRAGQIHTFYMEYFNQVRAPEGMPFKPEWFQHGFPPEDDPIMATSIYIDPAISPKRTADKTAIAVVSIAKSGKLYVRAIWAKRGANPREQIDNYFILQKRFDARRCGAESNAYQAALIHIMREEMFRKRQYFEIEPITHKVRKTERIMGVLVPRYSAGYVQHVVPFPDLETEMLDFRRDTDDQPDDCIDAVAGAIALLDPHAAQAAGEDLTEDVYKPIEEEIGEWGWAS